MPGKILFFCLVSLLAGCGPSFFSHDSQPYLAVIVGENGALTALVRAGHFVAVRPCSKIPKNASEVTENCPEKNDETRIAIRQFRALLARHLYAQGEDDATAAELTELKEKAAYFESLLEQLPGDAKIEQQFTAIKNQILSRKNIAANVTSFNALVSDWCTHILDVNKYEILSSGQADEKKLVHTSLEKIVKNFVPIYQMKKVRTLATNASIGMIGIWQHQIAYIVDKKIHILNPDTGKERLVDLPLEFRNHVAGHIQGAALEDGRMVLLSGDWDLDGFWVSDRLLSEWTHVKTGMGAGLMVGIGLKNEFVLFDVGHPSKVIAVNADTGAKKILYQGSKEGGALVRAHAGLGHLVVFDMGSGNDGSVFSSNLSDGSLRRSYLPLKPEYYFAMENGFMTADGSIIWRLHLRPAKNSRIYSIEDQYRIFSSDPRLQNTTIAFDAFSRRPDYFASFPDGRIIAMDSDQTQASITILEP